MVTMGSQTSFGVFVLPMSEEFQWSRSTISIAIAMASLVGGISQPVMGRIFDKLGGRKLILTGVFVTGLATLLLTFTSPIVFFIFIFGVVGALGRASGGLNTLAVLSWRWFHRRRSIAIAIISSGGSLGGLLIVPLAAFAVPLIGWRYSWTMLGLFLLALALPLAYIMIRSDPSDIGQLPDGAEPSDDQDGSTKNAEPKSGPLEVTYWMQSFRSLPMWQLLGGYMVCGITTNLMGAHYVPYAVEEGFSPSVAATAL